jgi:ATP-dependent protease HslVU (ClpYQ) peptidase subunit
MTTIIGMQFETGCWLASDSRTTGETGRPYHHRWVEKITERGEYLIAGSGDADACDIIQHVWQPPEPPKKNRKDKENNLFNFMVTTVSPSLRQCLEDGDYEQDKNDKDAGYLFLIALRGVIYEIDNSNTVSMRDDGIYGIGSGSKYAIGALYAGASHLDALEIAAINDIYTSEPFTYYEQNK